MVVLTANHESQGMTELAPVRLARLDTLPRNIGIPATDTILTGEPVGSAQAGVGAAEGDEKTGEAEKSLMARDQIPVEPVPFGVVAVSVVVSPLRAADLIAHVDHGNTLADHEEGHGILGTAQP